MVAPSTTCDECLRGRPNRCAGPGRCAGWRVHRRPKAEPVPRRKREKRCGRKPGSGKVSGLTPAQWEQAAILLCIPQATYRGVAEVVGCTYEQVRTVQRNLKALG